MRVQTLPLGFYEQTLLTDQTPALKFHNNEKNMSNLITVIQDIHCAGNWTNSCVSKFQLNVCNSMKKIIRTDIWIKIRTNHHGKLVTLIYLLQWYIVLYNTTIAVCACASKINWKFGSVVDESKNWMWKYKKCWQI